MSRWFDPGMEACVLGTLIRYPERILDCGVEDRHFHDVAHKRVLKAFLEKGVSLASASGAIFSDDARAMEIAESSFSDAGLEQHIAHLGRLDDCRKVADLAQSLQDSLEEMDPADIAEVASSAAAGILAAIAGEDDTLTYGEDCGACLDEEGGEVMQTFIEGLPVCRKELIGIAARPGCGKTTMAHLLGEHFSTVREGECFAVFTMEVTRKEWFQRTIRMLWGRAVSQFAGDGTKNALYQEARDAVVASYAKRKRILAVDDRSGLTVQQIRAKCLKLKAKHGKLSGVAIDQLSNIKKLREKGMTETQAIKNTTEALKQLARELDCPVFILSQMNRDPSGDGGWYTERDVYGSDGLLQDADQLWILQNPPGTDITNGDPERPVNLKRVKWRNGTLGEMNLIFDTPGSKMYKTF